MEARPGIVNGSSGVARKIKEKAKGVAIESSDLKIAIKGSSGGTTGDRTGK